MENAGSAGSADNNNAPQPNEAADDGALKFGDVSIFITMIASFLYTAGWSFAYFYFARFHVGVSALELQMEYYFIYGFWVVLDHPFWMLFILSIICSGIALAAKVRPLVKKSYVVAIVFFILAPALVAFFWSGYKLGETTAESRFYVARQNDYPDFPRVKVRLKHEAKALSSPLILPREKARLEKGCHRLLFQSKDKIFVFRSMGNYLMADLPTIIIPMAEVESMETLPQYSSCGK